MLIEKREIVLLAIGHTAELDVAILGHDALGSAVSTSVAQ